MYICFECIYVRIVYIYIYIGIVTVGRYIVRHCADTEVIALTALITLIITSKPNILYSKHTLYLTYMETTFLLGL